MDLAEIKVELVGAIQSFKQTEKDLKAQIDEMVSKQESDHTVAAQAAANADKLAKDLSDASARMIELEQKVAEGVNRGTQAVKTLGQLVVATDTYKQYAQAGGRMRVEVQANTITGQSGSPAANDDTLVAADRRTSIVPGAFRLLRIMDTLPNIPISSNLYEFAREAAWTPNAAETAEGAVKPESVLTFELVQAPVVTIAHFIKASKQILEDSAQLAAYIDLRMTHGVNNRIDAQLLNGTGTGQNLAGLQKSGNFVAFTPTSGDNAIDSLNRIKYDLIDSDEMPSGIILNPATWGTIERTKVGVSDARYIIGDPSGIIQPSIWGIPVIVSNNQTAGKVYCADMTSVGVIRTRTGTVVEMFEQDTDNVQRNLITIRAEARLALGVERPAAARFGDLTA